MQGKVDIADMFYLGVTHWFVHLEIFLGVIFFKQL